MRRRVGEELCAEILETVVDEYSALVVEEVLGAEAAAKMRGEEEARRFFRWYQNHPFQLIIGLKFVPSHRYLHLNQPLYFFQQHLSRL